MKSREVEILPKHNFSPLRSDSHDQNPGPGNYEPSKPFGHDGVKVKINEKREEKIKSTVGPGEYSPEKFSNTVLPSAPKYTMGSSRKASEFDPSGGPGTYSPDKEFGFDAKSFIIGEHRPQGTHFSVGPTDYNPTRADSLTKNKSREV